MSQADIQSAVRTTQPFEPLNFTLSTGEVLTVRRPDGIMIGKTTCAINVDGQIHLIANLHITRIAPLTVSAAS